MISDLRFTVFLFSAAKVQIIFEFVFFFDLIMYFCSEILSAGLKL